MIYFAMQQNKFMKTSNVDGGMKDPEENVSIMEMV